MNLAEIVILLSEILTEKYPMKKLNYSLLFILIFCLISNAQDKTADKIIDCPQIGIVGTKTDVVPGETINFTVNTSDSDKNINDYKINWSIDKGTIVSGQETSATVGGTEDLTGETLTATANVTDGKNCSFIKSETAVIGGGGDPLLFDEFGKVDDTESKKRFAAFIKEIKNSKHSYNGYIVNYGEKEKVEKLVERFRQIISENNASDEKFSLRRS